MVKSLQRSKEVDDAVEVLRHSDPPLANVQVGDKGLVVFVCSAEFLEVECVNQDGCY